MLGLLEAYGSDDSDSDSEREEPDGKEATPPSRLPNPFELPPPNLDGAKDKVVEKSVFINPYVAADNAKQALLEKHVKMISTDVRTVNGKKICWNYRNKKCRFGHNCKYAHDSDLQTPGPAEVTENKFQQAECQGYEIVEETALKKGLKRPGLSESVNPSKKVMKRYYDQKR